MVDMTGDSVTLSVNRFEICNDILGTGCKYLELDSVALRYLGFKLGTLGLGGFLLPT